MKNQTKRKGNKTGEKKNFTTYIMYLVKPYLKDGLKHFSHTQIGIAFRKDGSDLIDMKLDLFPVLISGAFIQLKPQKMVSN